MDDTTSTSDPMDQRVRQIDGFIRVLTQEVHVLDERRHILAPLIENNEVKERLNAKLGRSNAAHAWNHLPPLLGQDLLRDQSRLYLDEDKRSGSLTNIWRKLTCEPGLREHYRAKYEVMLDRLRRSGIRGDISPEVEATFLKRWREQGRQAQLDAFDADWQKIEDGMAALRTDAVALKIKTFRDKRHAHLEMSKLDEEPAPFDVSSLNLTFSEIFVFGDRCQDLVCALGAILLGEAWSPKQFAKVHERQGTDLWMKLSG